MFDKLVDLFLNFIYLFKCFAYIHPYEQGIVLRFGKLKRLASPGICWLLPFALEELLSTSIVPEPMMVGPQSLTTKDGHKIVVHALFVTTVEDIVKFELEFTGGNVGAIMMLHGTLAEFVRKSTLEDLTYEPTSDNDPKGPSHKLAILARRHGKRYGFGIESAQITELVECRSYRFYSSEKTAGMSA